MTRRLIIALVITAAISAAVAFLFSTGILSFIRWFVSAAIAQFLLQYIVSLVLDAKLGLQIRKIEQENFRMITKNEQPIECPCYIKHVQTVPIQFNEPIVYECEQCHKKLSARIELSSVLVTEPIPTTKLEETLNKIDTELKQNEYSKPAN
jgi:hypothetical protein